MALAYPLDFELLADCLTGPEIGPELKRFDEMSGAGDGRFWSATMAEPLWTAAYDLYARTPEMARRVNALINALDGMDKTFYWGDPYYSGPAEGLAGQSSVTVGSIRATDRGGIALSGLIPGQVISIGDYISIPYSSGTRMYMGQIAERGVANDQGLIGQREIRPYLPLGLNPGAVVELIKPVFTAMVIDYKPFKILRGQMTSTASISIMQKP